MIEGIIMVAIVAIWAGIEWSIGRNEFED